jgi:tetratricopeptide (TPR) repeat protein
VLAGRCLILLKNPHDAERALLFAVSRNPDLADAHRWLAVIYYDMGDLRRAVPHLREVARLDPADGRPHRLIGMIFKDMEQPDDAITAYEESLRRNPHPKDEVAVREELGEALLKQYREADALAALQGLDTPAAAVIRAEALLPLGRGDEVGPLLDDALKKWPDHGGLLRLRGERLRAAGNPQAALPLLERVVQLDPQDYRSRTQLAQCYETLGRSAEAAEQQKKIRELQVLIEEVVDKTREAMDHPWDAAVRYRLEELHLKLNRPEVAKMWHAAAEACRETR